MTSNFPLIRLPILAIECIILKMDLLQIIRMSQTSRKFNHRTLNLIRFPIDSIDIDVDKNGQRIELKSLDKKRIFKVLEFREKFTRSSVKTETLKLNGNRKKFKIRHFEVYGRRIEVQIASGETMKNFFEFLIQFFKLRKSNIDFVVHLVEREKADAIIESIISSEILQSICHSLCIYAAHEISDDNFRFILKNYSKVPKKLQILHPFYRLNSTFLVYPNPVEFSVDHLCITNGTWMTRATFFSFLNCKFVDVSLCEFTSDDYVEFVAKWMSGEGSQVEYVGVSPGYMIMELDLKRFDAKPWDPRMQKNTFEHPALRKPIDCSEGLNIVRADGQTATVIKKYQYFHFIVWKSPL